MAARVLIIDDHPVVRAGLRAFLDLQEDFEVVAEAGSLAEARERALTARMDLVLLDLELPDGSGLTLIAELARQARVLVLTSFLDEGKVRQAMRQGASGYLLKHAGPAALLDKLRAAQRGEIPLDPEAVRALASPTADPLAELTPREREVLRLMAEGLSNKGIAIALDISEKTVKTHAGHVFAKLGVRDRVRAVLIAPSEPPAYVLDDTGDHAARCEHAEHAAAPGRDLARSELHETLGRHRGRLTPQPQHRHQRPQAALVALDGTDVLHQAGQHQPGVEGEHLEATARRLPGERQREGPHPCLGRSVGVLVCHGPPVATPQQVDQPAPLVRQEVAAGDRGAEVHAPDVGVEHAQEVIVRHRRGGAVDAGHTGVVDPHVEPAEALQRRRQQRLVILTPGHVRDHAFHQVRAQAGHGRVHRCGRPRAHDHVRPLAYEGGCGCEAQPARASGDDGDPSLQTTHAHASPQAPAPPPRGRPNGVKRPQLRPRPALRLWSHADMGPFDEASRCTRPRYFRAEVQPCHWNTRSLRRC
ncbi:MAG: response regulator transcription factor [Deinococcales bacterium]